MKAKAFAPTNIALSKYWGKRDVTLNLPFNSSLSVTLKELGSTTTVETDSSFSKDTLEINGESITTPASLKKVTIVLDLIRGLSKDQSSCRVISTNGFPTGAGLASSASGLAALTLAASKAYGLNLSATQLSQISRQGSGSSCRSFHGGFVEWTDSAATEVAPATHLPLNVFVAVVDAAKKRTFSTDGMLLTQSTSPFFKSWVTSAQNSFTTIRAAVLDKNFKTIADESEMNCLRMHASAMASNPPILYWKPETLTLIELVRSLRLDKGLDVFFTIDAGPNVVIFSKPESAQAVRQALASGTGSKILEDTIGDGARSI